jgi:hypothetical protein
MDDFEFCDNWLQHKAQNLTAHFDSSLGVAHILCVIFVNIIFSSS